MSDNLQHLRFLNALFREAELEMWLDSGALLGLVRSRDLIKWDNDIDLGIWDRDQGKLAALKSRLHEAGYNLGSRKYGGKVYGYTISQHMWLREQPLSNPIHIHVYFRHQDAAWTPQIALYRPPPQPQLPCAEEDRKTRRLWIKAESAFKGTYEAKTLKQRLKRFGYKQLYKYYNGRRKKLDRKIWSTTWPFRAVCRTFTWVVPARFFENLETMTVCGHPFTIPSSTEAYLAARYGDGWREPDPFWCYWRDDKCLQAMKPDEWMSSI